MHLANPINGCIASRVHQGLEQGLLRRLGWEGTSCGRRSPHGYLMCTSHPTHLIPLIPASTHPLHSHSHSSTMNISMFPWAKATSPSTLVVSLDQRWFILKLMNYCLHLITNDLEGGGVNRGGSQWTQFNSNRST